MTRFTSPMICAVTIEEPAPQKPLAGRAVTAAPDKKALMLSTKAMSEAVEVELVLEIWNSTVVVWPAPTGSVRKFLVSKGAWFNTSESDAGPPTKGLPPMSAVIELVVLG